MRSGNKCCGRVGILLHSAFLLLQISRMFCPSYDQGLCRSCSLIELPYVAQLAQKQQQMQTLLPAVNWLPPVGSAPRGFRNKAKMVVSGTAEQPILGIVQGERAVDLTDCLLYPAPFQEAFAHIQAFIVLASLQPYDIASRRGELKYILLSFSENGGWLLRFVMRSQHHLAAIRKHLPTLQQNWPDLTVVTVNIQPEHKAVLEGELEFVLSEQQMLRQQLNDVPLYLQPQSFFQTNSAVAAQLYQTARDWTADLAITQVWDLFCGVGGFALHLAREGRQVTGIEISAPAIACASRSAAELGVQIEFRALDAAAFANAAEQSPDLLVVNPPRRGLGTQLCSRVMALAPAWLLYSSCNPQTLAQDLQQLADYQPVQAQLFDMFAHTEHAEVLVLLRRLG